MCVFWKGGIGNVRFKWWVGGTLRILRVHTWPKNPIMALISEYLSADLSPDASAHALAIFNPFRYGGGAVKPPLTKTIIALNFAK